MGQDGREKEKQGERMKAIKNIRLHHVDHVDSDCF
jgi:hypothetical protein